MAHFTVNAARFDPYKNFKFRVKFEGREVAAFAKASGPFRSDDLAGSRLDSNEPEGQRTKFEPITLERGLTHDPAFEQWSMSALEQSADAKSVAGPQQSSLHRDLVVELFDEAGKRVHAWRFFNCLVSEFVAMPELDATANAIAIEHLVIHHEGWRLEGHETAKA
jgi:phage tail-like protein